MKKILPLLFCLFLGLSACGPKAPDAQQRIADYLRLDSMTLKIGYLPTLESLPLLAAQEMGWLDSLGTPVKLIPFEAAIDLDTALQNKRVQLITTDLCRAILMNQKDDSIKVVGKTQSAYYLITAQKQRLRKPKDLQERMVAIARNEQSDCMLDLLLEQQEMNVDFVNRPQINSLALRREMILNQEIDATFLPEPYASQCMVNGDRNIANSKEIGVSFSCLATHLQWMAQFKEALQGVTRCYDKAVAWLNENPVNLQDYYAIGKQVADTIQIDTYQPLSMPQQRDIEKAKQWLTGRKLMKQTTHQLTDDSLIP